MSERSFAIGADILGGIWKPLRKGKPSTRGGQGGKSQVLKVTRRAHIPGVRHHKTAPLVKCTKRLPPGGYGA
jgi:hypothetical protein